MDELEIQGKKYISSKRAAERTGYAKDYVGQLARSKKIPATRVGRSWYVDEVAILMHANLPVPEEVAENKEIEVQQEVPAPVIPRSLPISEATSPLSSLNHLRHATGTPTALKTWSSVRYLEDGDELMPQARKEAPLQKEKVEEHTVVIKRATSRPHIATPTQKPAIVMDIIPPTPPVLKNKTEESHEVSQKQGNGLQWVVFASFAITVALIGTAASGIVLPHGWEYSGASLQAAVGGSDPISSSFLYIFDSGVTLIGDFLVLLFNSLGDFFRIGLQFFIDLVK